MYILPSFNIQDESAALDIITRWNFADLITTHQGKLLSNKIPLLLDRDSKTLYGHMGRGNEQLNHIQHCEDLLVVFSGPHTYVSPQWYSSTDMVPTWNFQTVQIRGHAQWIDAPTLEQSLAALSAYHEKGADSWSMQQLNPRRLASLLDFIQGFKIQITSVQYKEKMSQNRSISDQSSVIAALKNSPDQQAQQVVAIMENKLRNL